MCGIYFTLAPNAETAEAALPFGQLEQLLINRGPDLQNQLVLDNVILAGYVLWQQGVGGPCEQPIQRGNKFLIFSGDIYNLNGTDRRADICDTEYLINQFSSCNSTAEILNVFSCIEGPYSLVLLDIAQNCVYFARDALGRNSLLIEAQNHTLKLCSISTFEPNSAKRVMELPPVGVYKMTITDSNFKCMLYPWDMNGNQMIAHIEALCKNLDLDVEVKKPVKLQSSSIIMTPAPEFDFYKLFWKILGNESDKIKDLDQSHGDPFELKAKDHTKDLKLPPTLTANLIFEELLNVPTVSLALQQFGALLERSLRQRVQQTPPHCQSCMSQQLPCKHAKVAILFSGGIDCSILAKLVDKYIPPDEVIELVNVAFERVSSKSQHLDNNDWNVPDRITARIAYEELQSLCPLRQWDFIEVNVTRTELQQQLDGHIKHLIYPLNSVLDESLGAAFWFASQGKHFYGFRKSTARVVIIGSGADELFGGYSRHRNAYKRTQGDLDARNEAVQNELEMDWQRLPSRNLARDDRVIADHGRTARAPYIEEGVSQYVRSLAANQRACYALPQGIGDKLFLRLYGYHLGLRVSVDLKKRAIQFGSRIANKNQNATDESDYLKFS